MSDGAASARAVPFGTGRSPASGFGLSNVSVAPTGATRTDVSGRALEGRVLELVRISLILLTLLRSAVLFSRASFDGSESVRGSSLFCVGTDVPVDAFVLVFSPVFAVPVGVCAFELVF